MVWAAEHLDRLKDLAVVEKHPLEWEGRLSKTPMAWPTAWPTLCCCMADWDRGCAEGQILSVKIDKSFGPLTQGPSRYRSAAGARTPIIWQWLEQLQQLK